MMKEVKLNRFAGLFTEPPFTNFIQSLVGLVPKDGGSDTRLIFHLSYPRNGSSINSEMPAELCSVKYPDFSDVVRLCLKTGVSCRMGKSDFYKCFQKFRTKKKTFSLISHDGCFLHWWEGLLLRGQVSPFWCFNQLFTFPEIFKCCGILSSVQNEEASNKLPWWLLFCCPYSPSL